MKKFNAFLVSVLSAAALNAAVIEQVIVRQQWPWSTDVKVEYKITGVTTPVNIGVKAYNGDVEIPLPESAMVGDRYGIATDGIGQFTIDPVAAFGTAQIALANFKVKLTVSDGAANLNEVIYKVFDLTSGACRDLTRADFYNGKVKDPIVDDDAFETSFSAVFPDFSGTLFSQPASDVFIWTGVTNNVKYKTTHLVMRKITAKDVVWSFGGVAGEPGYHVYETNCLAKLTHDYYMGVFPLTQGQYDKIGGAYYGKYPSEWRSRDDADVIPVGGMMYGVDGSDGSASRAMYLLNFKMGYAKTGATYFEIPTSAEWEYSCRAGTTTELYDGHNLSDTTSCKYQNKIGWSTKISGGVPHPVGLKLPNSFGLYDQLGGICEAVSDKYSNNPSVIVQSFGTGWTPADVVVDPTGPADYSDGNKYHVTRGGYFDQWPSFCRAAAKLNVALYTSTSTVGVRAKLVVPAED